jgi:hypothetical protein
MPTSAQPNGSPSDKPGKSKLEREIEEILERAEREHPFPPPTPIRSRMKQSSSDELRSKIDLNGVGETAKRWLETAPLLVAFGAAIIGVLIRDVSPFLASIAGTAAVVALFWPIVASMRGPRSMPKTWRGQSYTTRQEPPEFVNRLRTWLRDKGILK